MRASFCTVLHLFATSQFSWCIWIGMVWHLFAIGRKALLSLLAAPSRRLLWIWMVWHLVVKGFILAVSFGGAISHTSAMIFSCFKQLMTRMSWESVCRHIFFNFSYESHFQVQLFKVSSRYRVAQFWASLSRFGLAPDTFSELHLGQAFYRSGHFRSTRGTVLGCVRKCFAQKLG